MHHLEPIAWDQLIWDHRIRDLDLQRAHTCLDQLTWEALHILHIQHIVAHQRAHICPDQHTVAQHIMAHQIMDHQIMADHTAQQAVAQTLVAVKVVAIMLQWPIGDKKWLNGNVNKEVSTHFKFMTESVLFRH